MRIGDFRRLAPPGAGWFWNPIARDLIICLVVLALLLFIASETGAWECALGTWPYRC